MLVLFFTKNIRLVQFICIVTCSWCYCDCWSWCQLDQFKQRLADLVKHTSERGYGAFPEMIVHRPVSEKELPWLWVAPSNELTTSMEWKRKKEISLHLQCSFCLGRCIFCYYHCLWTSDSSFVSPSMQTIRATVQGAPRLTVATGAASLITLVLQPSAS